MNHVQLNQMTFQTQFHIHEQNVNLMKFTSQICDVIVTTMMTNHITPNQISNRMKERREKWKEKKKRFQQLSFASNTHARTTKQKKKKVRICSFFRYFGHI